MDTARKNERISAPVKRPHTPNEILEQHKNIVTDEGKDNYRGVGPVKVSFMEVDGKLNIYKCGQASG